MAWFRFVLSLIICVVLFVTCNMISPGDDDDEDDLDWITMSGGAVDNTIYFVSPSGSDAAAGTDSASAFTTVKHALETVSPGGTIILLPGIYSEAIGVESGGGNAPIRIIGRDGTIMDGEDRLTIGIFFENCTGIFVESLTFQNYTDIGIGFSACQNIELWRLTIRENGHAVQLKGWELEGYGIHVELSEEVTIEECDVSRNGPDPQIIPDYLMGTGINTFGNQSVLIRNNVSYRNIGGGILVEDSFHVRVDSNEVYENDLDASEDDWWDGGIWIDGGGDVIVNDNVFRDNLGPGIEISDEDFQSPTGYVLGNNISTGNYYGIFIWNFGTNDWPDSSVIRRSGNEFTGNSREDVWIVDWY